MKKLTLIFIISIITFSGYAGHVDENTARAAAITYFKKVLDLNDITPSDLKLAVRYFESDALLKNNTSEVVYFYIFNLIKGKGFIIVSGDDNAEPILAYSKEGKYNNTNLSPNVQFWLNGYKNQMKELIENKFSGSEKTKLKWKKLINGTYSSNELKKPGISDPLVKSMWEQTGYYNSKCPGGSMTGCVATAMSQIMEYWKYPAQGIGYHSYNHNYYGNLYVDYANTTFDFKNMHDSLTDNSNQEEIDAVATLMYCCGVSVDMMYSPSGSYSYVILADSFQHKKNPNACAEYAYKTYFGYDSNTLKGLRRANYPDAEWKNLLKTDIDNKQPIQYAGLGTGGHTWVCDGYDANDYFHMNWGWGGQNNGFYHLDSLYPNIFSNYSLEESAIIGIQPALLQDIYELNNSEVEARTFPLVWIGDRSEIKTTGSNINIETDVDYYRIYLDAGYKYTITARVHDGKNSNNGALYSCDVLWSYDTNNGWSDTYDDLMPGNITLKGENIITFKISPYSEGLTGSYLLDVQIERTLVNGLAESGIKNKELEIFPNPVNQLSVVSYQLTEKCHVTLSIYDVMGKEIKRLEYEVKEKGDYTMLLKNTYLCGGIYFLRLTAGNETESKKLIITY